LIQKKSSQGTKLSFSEQFFLEERNRNRSIINAQFDESLKINLPNGFSEEFIEEIIMTMIGALISKFKFKKVVFNHYNISENAIINFITDIISKGLGL